MLHRLHEPCGLRESCKLHMLSKRCVPVKLRRPRALRLMSKNTKLSKTSKPNKMSILPCRQACETGGGMSDESVRWD